VPEKTAHSGVIAVNMRASDDEIGILRGAAEWCRIWSQDLISLSPRPDLRKTARAIADNASDFERRAAAVEQGNPDPGEARRKRAVEVHCLTRGSRKASPPRFMGIAAVCPAVPKRQDMSPGGGSTILRPRNCGHSPPASARMRRRPCVRHRRRVPLLPWYVAFPQQDCMRPPRCVLLPRRRRNALADCSGRQCGVAICWLNVNG